MVECGMWYGIGCHGVMWCCDGYRTTIEFVAVSPNDRSCRYYAISICNWCVERFSFSISIQIQRRKMIHQSNRYVRFRCVTSVPKLFFQSQHTNIISVYEKSSRYDFDSPCHIRTYVEAVCCSDAAYQLQSTGMPEDEGQNALDTIYRKLQL